MGRLWRRYSKARGGRDRRLLRVIPADARTRTCSPCCVVVALGGATGTAHPRAGSAGRARPSRSLAHIQATQVARTESTRAPSRPIKPLAGDANRKLRQPKCHGCCDACTRGHRSTDRRSVCPFSEMSVPRALAPSPAGAERPGVSARRRAVGDGRDDGEPGGAALIDDARSRREPTSASSS